MSLKQRIEPRLDEALQRGTRLDGKPSLAELTVDVTLRAILRCGHRSEIKVRVIVWLCSSHWPDKPMASSP